MSQRLAVIDSGHREYVCERLLRRRDVSEFEAEEAWQCVLVWVWGRLVAGTWRDPAEERGVLVRAAGKALRSVRAHERERRAGVVALDDAWMGLLVEAAGDCVEPSRAPEALRMSECWRVLSAKRKAAVQAVVLSGMRLCEFADLAGVRECTVSRHVSQGLDELRRRFDGTFVSRGQAAAETRRRKQSERAAG